MIRQKITTRNLLGLSAASLALSVPVLAGQNVAQLRGHWSAPAQIIPAGNIVAPQYLYNEKTAPCQAYRPCYAQPAQLRAALSHSVNTGHSATALNQGYSRAFSNSLPVAPVAPKSWGLPVVDMNQIRGRSQVSYDQASYNVAGYNLGAPHIQQAVHQSSSQYATDAYGYQYDVGGMSIRTNANHTDRMLDWQENTTGKAVTLLQHRQNGVLAPNSLTIGGGIKGGFMYQETDVAGQFPILSRFPNFSPSTDTSSGVFAINNAALAITGTFGDWTTIYLQPEYSETEYNSSQDEMQLRKAFVTFGNFDKSPLYAAFGRKTIDFGNFDGYNPFLHTEAQHYFWAQSDQPVLELGYYKNGLKMSATAFSGGRQLRTAYAGEENNIQNYAASIEKEFLLGNGASFTLGTSALYDSIYRNNWTAHTFADINEGTGPANLIEYRNSVGSAFMEYNSPRFDFMVEHTSTFEPWAAAIPQDFGGNVLPAYLDGNGDIDFDENLSVTVAQVRYKPVIAGKVTPISLVGSWGNISDEDYVGVSNIIPGQEVTFGKNQQHVLGIERQISPFLDVGAEVVYNKGFIPFVAPQEVSNQDTEAVALNVGFKARF